ncbi:GAT domain containing protein [Parasponia andersonii]|uniref:GAT domain containing protein n=1 Tax=Parasponia andersonii TaxID=3476 RepID=A0A2P5CNM5_PARAD|nr:GAT domain containing protein [Parasponia andersonii]
MKSQPVLNFLPNPRTHDDVTLSLLDTCKESQHVIKGIIERTRDDEGICCLKLCIFTMIFNRLFLK